MIDVRSVFRVDTAVLGLFLSVNQTEHSACFTGQKPQLNVIVSVKKAETPTEHRHNKPSVCFKGSDHQI